MVPRRSPYSKDDVILSPREIEGTLLELLDVLRKDSERILKDLKHKMGQKLNVGGRYALVFSCGSIPSFVPFLSIYTTDNLKSAVVLTTSDPISSGEILVSLNEKFDVLERSWRNLLKRYDLEVHDPKLRGVVLTRYTIPPSLAYVGDERFLKEKVLDEKLENISGILILLELDEDGVNLILNDVGKLLWDSFVPSFHSDRIILTLRYPEMIEMDSSIMFEISRYFRRKLVDLGKKIGIEIEEASVPSGMSLMKPLVSFSTALIKYPELREKFKFISKQFLEKLVKVTNLIEKESERWDL